MPGGVIGNTPAFGAVIRGSSPRRAAKFCSAKFDIKIALSNLTNRKIVVVEMPATYHCPTSEVGQVLRQYKKCE